MRERAVLHLSPPEFMRCKRPVHRFERIQYGNRGALNGETNSAAQHSGLTLRTRRCPDGLLAS